ncbi:MAG: 50S ribosomal protein L9 [Candidatus Promineifilaceae bacterium]
MKVLLKKDVDNLGYAGEVMTVADGYGRNYLLPRGMAVKATPNVLKEAAGWRDKAAVRMDQIRNEHDALAGRISAVQLSFTARAGDTGKLYGSITSQDIADGLNVELGTAIDRHIIIGAPLRQLGPHQVIVRLSRDYQPQVTVLVEPDGPVAPAKSIELEPALEEAEAGMESEAEVELAAEWDTAAEDDRWEGIEAEPDGGPEAAGPADEGQEPADTEQVWTT